MTEKETKKEKVKNALRKSYLCDSLSDEELDVLMSSSYVSVSDFDRGEHVFQEMDVPEKIMILVSGSLIIAEDTLSGRRLILSRIVTPGDTFGEVYVFKNLPAYDMYAETLEKSTVVFVHKKVLEEHDAGKLRDISEKMIRNQLRMFANKAYMMNRRLRILGSASIREKIARLLVGRQGKGNRVKVMGREEMADYLNVTRPSLSREISNMCKDGIIKSEGRTLVILDQERLEELIE